MSGPTNSSGSLTRSSDTVIERLILLEKSLKDENVCEAFLKDAIEWLGRCFTDVADDTAHWLCVASNVIVVLFEGHLNQPNISSEILRQFLEGVVEAFCGVSVYTCCELMEKLICPMLRSAADSEFDLVGRFELLATMNVVLSKVPSELRGRIWFCRELNSEMYVDIKLTHFFSRRFGCCLLELGDFDLQAHATALLLRLVPKKYRKSFAITEFGLQQEQLASKFASISESEFEMSMRCWLNDVNRLRLLNPKVISLPCNLIKLDDVALRSPNVPTSDRNEFWLDFNFGSQRITAYCIPPVVDSTTQISGTNIPMHSTWEILTIYPELIDVLDIQVEGQMVVLQFTLSDAIYEICDWAPFTTGNRVTVELSASAINDDFRSIRFTDICEDSSNAGLVRILQQLQSYPAFLSQEVTNDAFIVSRQVKPAIPRNRSLIAISPAKIFIPKNQEKLDPPCDVDPTLTARSSAGVERPVFRRVIASSPVHCECAGSSSQYSKFSPACSVPSTTTQLDSRPKVGLQQPDPSEVVCKVVSPASGDVKSDYCRLSTPSAKLPVEDRGIPLGYVSPEKHRKADLWRSPLSVLRVTVSPIADVDLDKSIKTESTVAGARLHASTNVNSATPLSCSSLGSIPTSKTQDPQVTVVPKSIELCDVRVCVSPCPLYSPPDVFQIAQSAATPTKVCDKSKIRASESCSQSQCVENHERQNVSLLSTSSRLSSSQDSTPLILADLSKFYPASTQVSVPDSRQRPTRKLCDTSVSFLPDLSPANALSSVTPERITVLALPEISAEVRLPVSKKLNVNRTTKGRNFDVLTDSEKTISTGPAVETLRRSDRLIGKRKPMVDPPNSSSGGSACSKSDESPAPLELRDRSPTHVSAQSTTPKTTVKCLNKPVSSLKKKKRFFTSSRSERMERERKRFEEACQHSTDYPRGNNNKSKSRSSGMISRCSDAPVKQASSSQSLSCVCDSEFHADIIGSCDSRKSLHRPQFAGCVTKAATLEMLAPVIETDCIAPSWESSYSSQRHGPNMRFGMTSPKTVEQKTGVILETSSEDISPPWCSDSNMHSLFATTPPQRGPRPNNDKKKRLNKIPITIPLQFVGTRRWLSSNSRLSPSDHIPDEPLMDLVSDTLSGLLLFFTFQSFILRVDLTLGKRFLMAWMLKHQLSRTLSLYLFACFDLFIMLVGTLQLRNLESRWKNVRNEISELVILVEKLLQCHTVLP
ncbi:hypothetical protein FGIG_03166 [Fasciola gigantica]|uniref:Synaptonemal complex protein 2 Spt16M-like domain-containing protein n=1 Tax=Fasciola gigantica TaxID=46835 RepID=A0A504YD95_FASGI|nr:hypothetical protein FGIG_03166 [Fasciola gigantica]